MIHMGEVEKQLNRLGVSFRFWGRAEKLELQHIMMPGEQLHAALNGRYSGGFAMLVATDLRLVLIDKKPLFLSVEDIRYDMIVEVDYNARLVEATTSVCTVNKTLKFTSMRQRGLRSLVSFVQQKLMEVRQHQSGFSQPISSVLSEGPMFNQEGANQAPQPTVAATYPLPATPADQAGYSNPYTRTPIVMRRRFTRFY